jgi:hypothetical protein
MTSTDDLQKCIDINGIEWCNDSLPPDKDASCMTIDGKKFCQSKGNGTTLRQEIDAFKGFMFYPKLRMDEARQMKKLVVEFTIGFIISSLIFVLSLYIKDILDYVMSFVMIDGSFVSMIIISIVLTITMIILSFMEYRISKSLDKTRVMEKFAEKNPTEMLNAMMDYKPSPDGQ